MSQIKLINDNPVRRDKSRGNTLIPIIIAVMVPSVITFLLMHFIFVPKMEKIVADSSHGDQAAHGGSHGDDHGDDHGDGKGHGTMHHKMFKGIVANLAGEHRTRFIKVSYEIAGSHKKFEESIDHSKSKITNATMEYLSGLSLANINNNPRMQELARKELKDKLNRVIKHGAEDVEIEELNFTEFTIQ